MALIVHGRGPDGEESESPPGGPSREELADVLERVHEQVRRARIQARQIELSDTLAPHIVSALRESLLLRVLRLRQFFYGVAGRAGEIVASDFFTEAGEWREVRPPAPPHLTRWLDDLADCIEERVYLDRARHVPEEAWPLASVVETLTRTHQGFCEAIVEHHEASETSGPWPESGVGDIFSDLPGLHHRPDRPEPGEASDPSDLYDLPEPPDSGISEARPGSH